VWNKGEKFEGVSLENGLKNQKGKIYMAWKLDGNWAKAQKASIIMEIVDKENYLMQWYGAVPGLIKGVHYFKLSKLDENRTLFENNEDFTGLAPALKIGFNFNGCQPMDEGSF
jgi:hypothetical protein